MTDYIVDPDAVGSPARDYSSIVTAWSDAARDLVSATATDRFLCRPTSGGALPISNDVNFGGYGWTTNSSYLVEVLPYNDTYKHSGQYDTSSARIHFDSATNWHTLNMGNNTWIKFIDMIYAREGVNQGLLFSPNTGGGLILENCVLHCPTSGEVGRFLGTISATEDLHVFNTLFSGYLWSLNWYYGGAGIDMTGSQIYHCTFATNYADHQIDFSEGVGRVFPDIKNLILDNQGAGAEFQDTTGNATYTAVDVYTSDATSPTSDDNFSADFVGSGDFTLDSAIPDPAGTDISGESPIHGVDFEVDWEGDTRSNHHVGFDEYVSGAVFPYHSIKQRRRGMKTLLTM